MEPIRGTNASLDIALIAAKAAENQDRLNMARVKLALDAQKIQGNGLVRMMEDLGKLIDTYA